MRHYGVALRRDAGLFGYERALNRHGLGPVAGVDEAGRGACAGPLVIAAVILAPEARQRLARLADSKLLTEQIRESVFEDVMAAAAAWSTVVISAAEIDRVGLHVANITGMRRAVARLSARPGYVLTDGFAVAGFGVESLAVVKGDRVVACVAAASVVAKVTRDRIMRALHTRYAEYDFAQHKGYVTAAHAAALARCGPCDEHRMSYVNVAAHAATTREARSLRLEDRVLVTSRHGVTETV
ncbi:ribonuclease HII [Frankia sp. CcI156]|jgi:ribonuclease HII|uniref:Ribonuclease HII n=1 Tax=Frankia casuarinae (strain DSM 45818 / CECT 9043 / HFP020203 / CcI3) TaxID=106370 RepID=RNH2_FRACC|nr:MULTISPECIES: ribonuclease HII [Frankia]Q2J702.1 RecName: Full=Ribonuclease HII; Short=RNase HII [Frankia casuarinae]ABD12940.1 Ribonuclease H [Frankia casuarinae]ETA03543.1 RNase HII [Frankia sp. CcI6]EYT93506.1 RNase HII [Frankia casuarinae]KDA43731.1 RNase HII [Frankia sp. BMG5.23]KFB05200.1 RNase HII [Frankia sp. Allo2]